MIATVIPIIGMRKLKKSDLSWQFIHTQLARGQSLYMSPPCSPAFFFFKSLHTFVCLFIPFPYKIFLEFSFFFSHLNLCFIYFLFLVVALSLLTSLWLNQQFEKPKFASSVYNHTKTPGHGTSLTLLLFIFVKFSLNSFFKSL